ncbi:hypothetical protein COW36_01470 [bacterium (Candidatus Blackallbacteria) CG17_big_fil_post_rev_8_21_14_2_50_48_46]|uniref:DUF642 domain-containing protein n=1 Tax=bacterium (Candidatus Blackallbacteria) CG17_big_fil_post_rev_8_21_14_2_50_48_46 TaxID=2014261 RepID=A0A2M7GBI7_9BACT|nr:MAG: hypothetical protein COW64_09705 [bacterium (Candidatus Blackallbacteria) CG18_big_fil_WC_8_21_14_2_50_49_26]PIW19536.1 MAG: hypothetical protein COW36_01470 [bacterium (Candidatus Blackallbacteria) CG17_big_fil_post_rev_8_21_14_2_50_48_46]PIW48861.1 MAG: hypothetical protein COW20_06985 [bacterium (Candidatus Blackallbacteria) CG13_big_fil_rev_8_21_14_2_50_49_14]
MRQSPVFALMLLAACQSSPSLSPPQTSPTPAQTSLAPSALPVSSSPLVSASAGSSASPSASPVLTAMPQATPQATPQPTPSPSAEPIVFSETPGCLTPPASGNKVRNGDFETPVVTKVGYQIVVDNFDSWKVDSGTVELVGTLWSAGSGAQSLDLDGKSYGSLSQSLATQAGQAYQLSFCLSANPDGLPKLKLLEIYWNNRSLGKLSVDSTGKDRVKMGWVTRSVKIPADWTTAEVTPLRIQSRNSSGGSWGAVLDALVVLPVS